MAGWEATYLPRAVNKGMALATRCPHCKTTFRVASDQLKLRGGIVRCGTCNQVFDGNASLVDLEAAEPKTPPPAPIAEPEVGAVSDAAMPREPEPQVTPAPQRIAEPEPEAMPEPERTAEPEPQAVATPAPEPAIMPAPAPPPVATPSASDIFDNQIAAIEASSPIVMPPGYVLDFDLSDPVWHVPEEEPEPIPHPPPQPDNYAESPTQFSPDDELEFERLNDAEFDPPVPGEGELSLADEVEEVDAPFSSEQPHDEQPQAPQSAPGPLPLLRAAANETPPEPVVFTPAPEPEAEHDEPEFVRLAREKEQAAWRRRLTLGAGSLLLTVALAAQGVLNFRNVLAARYPALKPALAAACVPLQCKIELPAQIDNLVIETGELQTISASTFQLTTLLRNESGLTQAWPYIELELKDANDKVVVRRVFTPPQYLPAGAAPKGFAGHAEQPVKIHFELKQLKASGFNIAVFYP